jgi:hypothetical protein
MNPKLTRRRFLRAAGVSLALPAFGTAAAIDPPRRLVCVCTPLGLHAPHFVPKTAGADYEASPYLEIFKDLRGEITPITGLAHPDVGASHDSIYSFLTAAPHPEQRAGFRNTISLDQFAADRMGERTRYPSLALSCEGFSLSWTRTGAIVPSDSFPSSVFAKLFLEGRPDEVEAQKRRLANGRSILDSIGEQSKGVRDALGAEDREKLDEYYTGVRELERRLARAEEWAKKPKPKVDAKPPQNVANPADLVAKAKLMFDLIHLAFQTDSTRLVTLLLLGTSLVPPVPGVSFGHHDLSHHGQDPKKIEQLKTVETEKLKVLREFLLKLKGTNEAGETLLDRTTVFFGSNLGNASNHSTRNLPVVLAGGGFRHGKHLAFDPNRPPPLANLYVSLLQRLGIPAEKFGSGTGTLAGLEMKS